MSNFKIDKAKVVRELNKIRCPQHNEFVKAELINGEISTKTCCEEIHKQIKKVMDKTVLGDVDKAVQNAFKKLRF